MERVVQRGVCRRRGQATRALALTLRLGGSAITTLTPVDGATWKSALGDGTPTPPRSATPPTQVGS
ncbi:hypothetical protein ABZZ74_11965 [Streptomyces sp. NPDC006476]|uniref:hypothetical protein n=1 Tax=Streptomyces sp. NPDC006476 TaxID=3157175 RepID=UPI0033B35E67